MTGRKSELTENEIFDMAETKGLAPARYAYQETYGVAIDDKAIDAEIKQALLDSFDGGPIKIRLEVLLAIWLRENALRGRGRRKTPEQRYYDMETVKDAKSIKKALMAKGLKADEAAKQAAEKVKAEGHTTLSMTEIIYRINLRKSRPPRKRRRRDHSAE
jgi:hypothetical protein